MSSKVLNSPKKNYLVKELIRIRLLTFCPPFHKLNNHNLYSNKKALHPKYMLLDESFPVILRIAFVFRNVGTHRNSSYL